MLLLKKCHEALLDNGCIAPHINLNPKRRWVASLTSQPLLPWGKSPAYSPHKRHGSIKAITISVPTDRRTYSVYPVSRWRNMQLTSPHAFTEHSWHVRCKQKKFRFYSDKISTYLSSTSLWLFIVLTLKEKRGYWIPEPAKLLSPITQTPPPHTAQHTFI